LALAILALHVLKLTAAARRGYVYALSLLSRIAVVAVTGITLSAGHWIVVSGPGLSAGALSKIDHGVNMGFEISLIMVAVVSAGMAAYDAWSLYRSRRDSGS